MAETDRMETWTWVASLLAAILFLLEGITKLAEHPSQVEAFARWGYPTWFMYVVGAAETAGGLALLLPRTSWMAAIALCGLMVGAATTHIRFGEWVFVLLPIVGFALCSFVAWQRVPVNLKSRLRPRA